MCGSDIDGPIYYARHSDLAFVFKILFWDDLISVAFATFIALTNEVSYLVHKSSQPHRVISELMLMKTYIISVTLV